MDIPKVKIEDTPMQAFVRDEISSYRMCKYLYSDRLQLLSDKSRYSHPIKIQEEEALRLILIAYKKLDAALISQVAGLTPYYDCNLSNLTNIHADAYDSQSDKDLIVIILNRADQIMDQGRNYCKDDDSFNRTIKSNLARRIKIRDELHYHCNRYEVYMSRYDAFDKKRKSTYGVRELAVCEVAQTVKDLISLTKRIIDELVREYDMELIDELVHDYNMELYDKLFHKYDRKPPAALPLPLNPNPSFFILWYRKFQALFITRPPPPTP